MSTNPNENPTQFSTTFAEFRRKGYQCREVREHGATTFFFTHDKKGIARNNEIYPAQVREPIRKFQGLN